MYMLYELKLCYIILVSVGMLKSREWFVMSNDEYMEPILYLYN